MTRIRTQLLFFFVLLLAFCFSPRGYAAETSIHYTGETHLFDFGAGSAYSDTDLFHSFKNVMPGDTLTQSITVTNTATDCDYIKLYLKAVPAKNNPTPSADTIDFLSQLTLKVFHGDTLLFADSPDESGGLTDFVSLGTLSRGETTAITVELSLPLSMDNRYANRVGSVDWIFLVESFAKPLPPKEDPTRLTVRKVWEGSAAPSRPNVTVELLQNGMETGRTVLLHSGNHWMHSWSNLNPQDTWSVCENVPEGYAANYQTDGHLTTITNRKLSPDSVTLNPKMTSLTAQKQWEDVRSKDRPSSVDITLYRGNTPLESVTLGDWNHWSYTWNNLTATENWQIVETNPPKGYTPSYQYQNGIVTITNTATLIQAGQYNWPILLLLGLGTLFFVLGLVLLHRKEEEKDA